MWTVFSPTGLGSRTATGHRKREDAVMNPLMLVTYVLAKAAAINVNCVVLSAVETEVEEHLGGKSWDEVK